jgi:hypothetical protein
MMEIQAGKLYRNNKTKGIYVVLHIGLAAWDSSQRLIVYQRADIDEEVIWIRSRKEFGEKFEEITNEVPGC